MSQPNMQYVSSRHPSVRGHAGGVWMVLVAGLVASACSDVESPVGPVERAEANASVSPFAGSQLYVFPWSDARKQADLWRSTRPADAAEMDKIAAQADGKWFGDWNSDIRVAVDAWMDRVEAAGSMGVLVVYNIPSRDCGYYSSGGAATADAYRTWIRQFAKGIGSRRAAVVLEPDALGLLDRCLSSTEQETRLKLLKDAVRVLKKGPGVSVYIDAGNSGWVPAGTMAKRLRGAGIRYADGFALNVANFHWTSDNIAYGERVSAKVGGKHFVIDTSRNGLGGTSPYEWCNPDGRALGTPPTANTGHPLVDAYLWVKPPGDSDGSCNGGPSAGAWWAEYALGLANRASW